VVSDTRGAPEDSDRRLEKGADPTLPAPPAPAE